MPSFAARLAAQRPDEIALSDEAGSTVRSFSWHDIDDTLNRVANGLQTFEVGERRRIAVFAENSAETAMANLGGLIGGMSVVPVNFHLTAEEVAYILEDAGVQVLFAGGNTHERAAEAVRMAGVPVLISWQAPETGTHLSWETWLAEQSGDAADESCYWAIDEVGGVVVDGLAPFAVLLATNAESGCSAGVE